MSYAAAGLGKSLAGGMGVLSQSLMGISESQQRRSMYEDALKTQAEERKYQREQDDATRSESTRRYNEGREDRRFELARADTIRRETAMSGAFDKANEYTAGGQTAIVNPAELSITGDPTKPGAQLGMKETLPSVPRITLGAYDPENDIGFKRQKGIAEAYVAMGGTPRGGNITTPTGIKALSEERKALLRDKTMELMTDPETGEPDFKKYQSALQAHIVAGATEPELAFIRSLFTGATAGGGGGGDGWGPGGG